MMNQITRDQAQALAELVHLLRDDWDTRGVLAALAKARDKAPAEDVCIATIRAAAIPTNRTPAVIAMAGPHWADPTREPSTTGVVPGPHDPRCDRPGHEHYRAANCPGCRTEALERGETTGTPTLTLTPEQIARNRAGAHLVRQAITHGEERTS